MLEYKNKDPEFMVDDYQVKVVPINKCNRIWNSELRTPNDY